MVGGEKVFSGGLDASQAQFDHVLSKLFRASSAGEFHGIWLNRLKNTQFDDIDKAIYFQRQAHITGRVVGEEVQHAIDFTMGAVRSRVYNEALQHVPKAEVVDWWHRRVFTRSIQNADQGNHGLGSVSGHFDDIYRRYQFVGGRLSLDEIHTRKFDGLY